MLTASNVGGCTKCWCSNRNVHSCGLTATGIRARLVLRARHFDLHPSRSLLGGASYPPSR